MTLFSYWRSTTAFRVRAVLNLKAFDYRLAPLDLSAGQHFSDDYVAINPGKGVPALMLDDGRVLTQSLAIIDYLDAIRPMPPMLPADPVQRAQVLAVVNAVATDIHPVNNLRVLEYLGRQFGADTDQRRDWMRHWMSEGFTQIEALLPPGDGFAFGGDTPDLADICITAQVYNAHRWRLDLTRWPRIAGIEVTCLALPEIAAAHPDNQIDAIQAEAGMMMMKESR